METQKATEDLLEYCRDEVGDHLRTITRYSRDRFDPVYTREDLIERLDLDADTRGSLRIPLLKLQNAVWLLSNLHPTLDEPDVAVYSYGPISMIQFPVTRDEGVVVSFDWEGELSEALVSGCKSIVYGPNKDVVSSSKG